MNVLQVYYSWADLEWSCSFAWENEKENFEIQRKISETEIHLAVGDVLQHEKGIYVQIVKPRLTSILDDIDIIAYNVMNLNGFVSNTRHCARSTFFPLFFDRALEWTDLGLIPFLPSPSQRV